MKHKREDVILKYYNVLKDIHFILQNTEYINMAQFLRKKHVKASFHTAIVNGGLVKCITKGGRRGIAKWKWNTIPPTREMAIETHKRVLEESRRYYKPKGTPVGRPKKTDKPVSKKILNPERKIKYYLIKLFWGLIKIKITPVR